MKLPEIENHIWLTLDEFETIYNRLSLKLESKLSR